jgi:peptidoglycan/LPS O-acetylase OafA/YrhL
MTASEAVGVTTTGRRARSTRAHAPASWSYRPQLDGVRAFAILAVIGFHYFPRVFRGGYLGVELFFVLSGYLITGLLVSEHSNASRIDLRAFWARRALRLYPALFVVVVVTLILAATTGHPRMTYLYVVACALATTYR